jgi:hypothetical protein
VTIDGFRIDDTALMWHAGSVNGLASRVRTAAGAARPLRRDAYGLVGQVFAEIADDSARTAAQAVADVAEALQRHGDGVEVSRGDYRVADHTLAALFRELP